MIAKPEWFARRKYGGWGLYPKTWQGYVYIAVLMIPFIIFQSLPMWDTDFRIYVTIGWLAFVLIDIGNAMILLKQDERDDKIEALAERNAAWMMVLVIALGIVYEATVSSLEGKPSVDIFLIIALGAGLMAKLISNLVLERREL